VYFLITINFKDKLNLRRGATSQLNDFKLSLSLILIRGVPPSPVFFLKLFILIILILNQYLSLAALFLGVSIFFIYLYLNVITQAISFSSFVRRLKFTEAKLDLT